MWTWAWNKTFHTPTSWIQYSLPHVDLLTLAQNVNRHAKSTGKLGTKPSYFSSYKWGLRAHNISSLPRGIVPVCSHVLDPVHTRNIGKQPGVQCFPVSKSISNTYVQSWNPTEISLILLKRQWKITGTGDNAVSITWYQKDGHLGFCGVMWLFIFYWLPLSYSSKWEPITRVQIQYFLFRLRKKMDVSSVLRLHCIQIVYQ